jgi:hypothetical protein
VDRSGRLLDRLGASERFTPCSTGAVISRGMLNVYMIAQYRRSQTSFSCYEFLDVVAEEASMLLC